MNPIIPVQKGVFPGRIVQGFQRRQQVIKSQAAQLHRDLTAANRAGEDTAALVRDIRAIQKERNLLRKALRPISEMQGRHWLKL